MTPAELAIALAAPLIGRLTEWLSGRGPEPPELVHLGVPATTLADYRQRAAAARVLRSDT